MQFDNQTIATGNYQSERPVHLAGVMMMAALILAGTGCTRPSDLPDEYDAACIPSDLLAGEWIGEMASATGATSRRIQATYRPADEGTYLATYCTTVGLGLPVQFDCTHRVTECREILWFDEWREADVPGLGGVPLPGGVYRLAAGHSLPQR
jgi:hypothetical protein